MPFNELPCRAGKKNPGYSLAVTAVAPGYGSYILACYTEKRFTVPLMDLV
jgi:hypothetical protein